MRQRLIFIATFVLTVTKLPAQEVVEAENWLKTAIEDYFAEFPPKPLTEITSGQYAEYKQDAICVIYDCENSLTKEQFEKKWGNIYEIEFAGYGEGFLIEQQDWDKIVVTECRLLKQPKEGIFIFETVLTDTGLKLTNSNEITVVLTANGFKIDDVKRRE